jgi:hypothetical protein
MIRKRAGQIRIADKKTVFAAQILPGDSEFLEQSTLSEALCPD